MTKLVIPLAKFSACLVAFVVVLATPPLLIASCFLIAAFCIWRLFHLPSRARHVKPPTYIQRPEFWLTRSDLDWLKAHGYEP